MEREETALAPEEALKDIRGMMAKSSRFISLSGWSGVWAGCVALFGAFLAYLALKRNYRLDSFPAEARDIFYLEMLSIAAGTFLAAFSGAWYFTKRKARKNSVKMWNATSKQLMWGMMLPMITGGIFCGAFLMYGSFMFLAPACLAFYGLALINASKYTLGEIRWLGYGEVLLGSITLFFPRYGLYFMAAGFGILHILYGIFMWNKYDKRSAA